MKNKCKNGIMMTRQVINSVKIISAAINEFGKRYYGLAIAIAIISGISSPISTLLVRALINNGSVTTNG